MPSIQGNFRGSRVRSLTNNEKKNILEILEEMPETGIIEGVPGANKDDEKYQGIDRLINVMYGDSYCFLVVAKPLNTDDIGMIQDNLYKFYDNNAPFAKLNIQTGKGSNTGKSDSYTTGKSKTDGSSGSTTDSNGTSESDTHTDGENWSKTKGTSHSNGENTGSSSNSKTSSQRGS